MFTGLLSFDGSLAAKCVSLNNQSCQVRSTLIDVNSNEPLYYPLTVSVNKCDGGCNTNNGLYAQLCVPNKVKNVNTKKRLMWNLSKCDCECYNT